MLINAYIQKFEIAKKYIECSLYYIIYNFYNKRLTKEEKICIGMKLKMYIYFILHYYGS